MARFYSTQGYQDGRRTRDTPGRQSLRSMDTTERETLRQRLNTFARQARKSSSIRRFEPCYRQIYPSKKRKTTFKIPKKPPYIPAVYQKQTTSYRDKYNKMDLEQVKGRRLQWPPLYPSKRKDCPHHKQSGDKNQELPSWLLPLYSCKTCHNEDVPSTSEARFSGGAFRRKMEIMQSIKQIRANQDVIRGRLDEKETKKDESTNFSTNKSANAVEALKRRINSMHDYLSAMKNMEAYRNKDQTRKTDGETELADELVPVRQAYARIYQTKPPTLDQEVRVRKSMGLGVAEPKSLAKPVPGTSGKMMTENTKETDNDKKMHTPKKQHGDSAAQNPEVNSTEMVVKCPDGDTNNNLCLGQIHKESVVMIKQPSWKKQQVPKSHANKESVTGEKKTQTLNSQTNLEFTVNQIRVSPKQRQGEAINDTSMTNQQSRSIKIKENKAVDGSKTDDAWTVASLKSRINVMKIKNTSDEGSMKKLEDMTLTRNGGEVNPKISQVALRSFHKEAGFRNPRKIQVANTTKPRLGYQRAVNRRHFSTFRPFASEPATRALGCYSRTIFNTSKNQNKKRSWVSRLKRCFLLKKIKGSKRENWKEAPREIPYASEDVKYNSPAPILWKPSELDCYLEKRSKPAEIVFTEKVNPAVLNAEQRVLASISRLISTKSQSDVPDVRIVNINNNIKRAKNKVNVMNWLKRSKSTDTVQTLKSQQRGSFNKLEKDQPQESGYEWILKNRDMVEELKRQSRYAAGKTLVPTEVKNAINQYKLPLKGEISRYRKKMDQKCSEQFYLYSTSKRWYSTCSVGKHRRMLTCSDVILVNTRGIKTMESQKENGIPSKFLDRKTSSDVVLGPNFRRYNQGVSSKHRKSEEINENPVDGKRPNRWAWKIPNKTRAFTPKTTTLTSPSKAMGTKMSEMSPCALKKQVEELKRLIKKSREETAEATEEFPIEPKSGDKYEDRLKRLVKAALNNAQKMQIVGPKYTSENNMMVNKPSSGKRNNSKPIIQYGTKSANSKRKPEVSVLKSLFRKTKGESKTLADEILFRNNLTSLPAMASNKSEKPISKVYLKLKSLVEAVRNKSATLDPISDVKLLPSKSLKGSLSVDAMLPLSKNIMEERGKLDEAAKLETSRKDTTSLVTVELSAQRTPAPSETIQLWKGESKPKEFNFLNDKEPTYGDLLTLFTKAKALFYYQPPVDKIIDGKSPASQMHNNSNISDNQNIVTKDEKTENWLSIREDISNAARAVSELKNDPQRKTFPASSHLVTVHQNNSTVDTLSEYMMTKSKMMPFELLKSEFRFTCDRMWASVPVKVQEDEDLCRKPSIETDPKDENQSASQKNVESTSHSTSEGISSKTMNDNLTKLGQPESKTNQQESQKPVCFEPPKLLHHKRMITLGSLTKNFGSGVGSLLGAVADSSKNTDMEAALSNKTARMNQEPKTEDALNSSVVTSNLNYNEMKHSHDANMQSQSTSGGDLTFNSSHATDNIQEVTYLQNATITNSIDEQATQPEIKVKYAQDCIESLKPLEGKVKEYENYYRHYFTEDIVSGYEHLHQAYDGLIKLNKEGQYQSLENPFKIEMETQKEGSSQLISNPNASASAPQTTKEETNTPIEMVSVINDLNSHGLSGIRSDGLTEATKAKQDGTMNQNEITVMKTSGTQVLSLSGGVSEIGFNDNGHTIGWQQETDPPANAIVHEGRQSEPQHSDTELTLNADNDCQRQCKPTDVTCNTESYIDASGEIRERIQMQKSDPVQMGPTNSGSYPGTRELKDHQPKLSGVNNKKEEPVNFEDMLTQDPTLNPDVVKNLKLPVILPEDCHAERNWYTKFFSGPNQNH